MADFSEMPPLVDAPHHGYVPAAAPAIPPDMQMPPHHSPSSWAAIPPLWPEPVPASSGWPPPQPNFQQYYQPQPQPQSTPVAQAYPDHPAWTMPHVPSPAPPWDPEWPPTFPGEATMWNREQLRMTQRARDALSTRPRRTDSAPPQTPRSHTVSETTSSSAWSGSGHGHAPSSAWLMGGAVARQKSFNRSVAETQKRPPREWRTDFSMPRSGGFSLGLSTLLSRTRSLSISHGELDRVSLHPYLRHAPSQQRMSFDLRCAPSMLRFRWVQGPVTEWDLMRFVCEPPVSSMLLYSPYFPWTIEVRTGNPVGITLLELFSEIWRVMMTPVTQADYWNAEMDEKTREKIAFSWAERCDSDMENRKKGVRRVDYLMERVYLEGFAKGKDGMWEMKIKK